MDQAKDEVPAFQAKVGKPAHVISNFVKLLRDETHAEVLWLHQLLLDASVKVGVALETEHPIPNRIKLDTTRV